MRNWFLSLNGAITLSVIAFLSWFGRNYLDWQYEMRPGIIYLLFSVAAAGGWVWAMLAAIHGSRGGLIVCLILALLLDVVIALMTVFYWCPPWTGCICFPHLWPWNWAQLILGLLAVIALVFQLRQKKAAGYGQVDLSCLRGVFRIVDLRTARQSQAILLRACPALDRHRAPADEGTLPAAKIDPHSGEGGYRQILKEYTLSSVITAFIVLVASFVVSIYPSCKLKCGQWDYNALISLIDWIR